MVPNISASDLETQYRIDPETAAPYVTKFGQASMHLAFTRCISLKFPDGQSNFDYWFYAYKGLYMGVSQIVGPSK